METKIVDHFEIPEDIARRLSDLLIKQTIRERILVQNMNDPDKFAMMEELLMPITAQIERIKYEITNNYVPQGYNSSRYSWNYNGWEISAQVCDIIENA